MRRSERGTVLVMMSLQSSHLTHAWYTVLCSMSHHVSFLLLNGSWNSVPSRSGCCVCGVNAIHSESICLCTHQPLSSITAHHQSCNLCNCHSVIAELGALKQKERQKSEVRRTVKYEIIVDSAARRLIDCSSFGHHTTHFFHQHFHHHRNKAFLPTINTAFTNNRNQYYGN